MSTKTIIWISVLVFSIIGGYISVILGQDLLSAWGIIGSGVGGLFGIWIGFKVGNFLNG